MAELRKCIAEGRECTVRLLNYNKDGRPFWNMLTVAPIRDVEGKPRFLVGVQIDVTEHPTEAAAAPVGASAASAVGAALQNLSWVGVDPWATFPTGPVRMKPHRAGDAAAAALRAAAARDGKLRLRHFQRVRQLGSGDVGMVDLVQLAPPVPQPPQANPGEAAAPAAAAAPTAPAAPFRFALKSLEKREMLDRNKVGRVKTEALILGAVDHPFLATCYAMLQTGERAEGSCWLQQIILLSVHTGMRTAQQRASLVAAWLNTPSPALPCSPLRSPPPLRPRPRHAPPLPAGVLRRRRALRAAQRAARQAPAGAVGALLHGRGAPGPAVPPPPRLCVPVRGQKGRELPACWRGCPAGA